MNLRRLLNLSSLLIGIAFALAASASQFSMSSRVTLGPSLNKDIASAAPPSPAASPIPAPAASTTAPFAQPMAPPAAQATITQPTIVVVQPERPPNAMERAGQLVRSVLRKIDPKPPVDAPHDAVDLNRSRSPAQPLPLNASMNKQQKNVTNADPSKEQRQLQRGIMNDQKMNVGMNQ